jgi:hypothetical protein
MTMTDNEDDDDEDVVVVDDDDDKTKNDVNNVNEVTRATVVEVIMERIIVVTK